MKKTLFIAIVALAIGFASCKKDRTCTCTHSEMGSTKTDTEITTYTNVTEKSALATCNSGTSYDPSDPSEVHTRSCVLK